MGHSNMSGQVVVTRKLHFNAAHRLHNPEKSDEWNSKVFGPCNSPNWHGHNYVLEVSVRGVPDRETGYVIDLGNLKRITEEVIIAPCDHRNLNLDVNFLRGVIPSVENLVVAFWNQLAPALQPHRLFCLRLYETERNWADYFGPPPVV